MSKDLRCVVLHAMTSWKELQEHSKTINNFVMRTKYWHVFGLLLLRCGYWAFLNFYVISLGFTQRDVRLKINFDAIFSLFLKIWVYFYRFFFPDERDFVNKSKSFANKDLRVYLRYNSEFSFYLKMWDSIFFLKCKRKNWQVLASYQNSF